MSESEMIETEVAIIGCGPIGAMIANLLGSRGVRTVVLEKAPGVYQLPRAVGMDDEVLRMIQSQSLEHQCTNNLTELKGMDLLRGNRRRLRRVSLEREPRVLGHPIVALFHQPTLEVGLRKGLERFASHVDVRLSREVGAICDLGDRIEIDATNVATGEKETIRASYVLGCDGGRSVVRKFFGVEQEDLGLHQPWIVVDVIMKKPFEETGYAEQICDPARPGTFVPTPAPRKRWEFMIMPGDDPEEVCRADFLAKLIRPWAAPEDYEIERAAIYTFHALVAKKWRFGRTGRALLVGDAAHQMPPFLGQGMCAGMRDAFNLAWKLELVLRGEASPELLDSYESERAEHVRKVIALAVRIGKIIQSSSHVKSFLVNSWMVLAERLRIEMPVRSTKNIPLGPGFYSVMHPPGKKGRSPFPQPFVERAGGSRCLLDRCLGNSFTLLTRKPGRTDDETTQPEGLVKALRVLPPQSEEVDEAEDCVRDIDGGITSWLDRNRCDAVLLRPDRQPFGIYRGREARYDHVLSDLEVALKRPETCAVPQRHVRRPGTIVA